MKLLFISFHFADFDSSQMKAQNLEIRWKEKLCHVFIFNLMFLTIFKENVQ